MAWRDLVQHNFWWKLTAIVLASLIWLTVDKGERGRNADKFGDATRRFERVPVQILTEPGFANSISITPKTVSFVARGQSGVLELLSTDDFTVYARINGRFDKTNGRSPVRVNTPDGVHVEEILPSEITFEKSIELGPKPHFGN
ncbi:MAG: hypothetical protein EXS36_20575 [Pedosphaera sp.]|nr:hypothetical protein [Pedosphaera sp.]